MHRLHNQSIWYENLFAGKIENWYNWYLSDRGLNHYGINSLLFLTTTREKHVKMYERFINQLKMYSQVMKSFIKRLFTYFSLTTLKLNIILQEVNEALQVTNRDYDLVIKAIHLL